MVRLLPRDRIVDLNADLGEEVTDDQALLAVVTSANVACGYHAGSRAIMRAVCAEAAIRGVTVGAQVSYADRENFGRVAREVSLQTLTEQVLDQVGTLRELAVDEGVDVRYVKPHGALYHRVIDDPVQASAVLAGSGDLAVLGFPQSELLRLASEARRVTFTEAFPDRGYGVAGRLLPRADHGAVLSDPEVIAQNAVALAGGVSSLCIHGDSPGAVATAEAVRRVLEVTGWQLKGL